MSTGPDPSPLVSEQLSAWLDDELPAEELELLASRLARSPEHRARIARYSLIGSTLRGGQAGGRSAGMAALQIAGRVSAELDDLAAPAATATAGPGSRPGYRLLPYAVAAGVALIAVALLPFLRSVPGATPAASIARQYPVAPAALAPASTQSLVAERVGSAGRSSLSPRRLTSYLVYHGEYSGMLSAKLTDSHIVNNRAYAVALRTEGQPVQ
ncbi:MAG: sigma-E factor negative regulatory protein [Gammaproteobacteria bacterium]